MSKPLKLEISNVTLHCHVPLNARQWKKANRDVTVSDLDWQLELMRKMKQAGAIERSIEWNGHFGSYIHFDAHSAEDAKKVLAVLESELN